LAANAPRIQNDPLGCPIAHSGQEDVMTLTVLSPGMSHRIILLTVAVLMPALGSAQDLRDSASRASLNAPLPNVWTLRDSARAYPLPTIQSDRERERFHPSSNAQAVGKPHSAIGWAIAIGGVAG